MFVRLQSNKENYLIEAGDDSRQENMKLNKNIYTMTVDRSQTNPRFASEDLTPKNRPRVESEKQFYLGSQVGRNHITSHHVIIP